MIGETILHYKILEKLGEGWEKDDIFKVQNSVQKDVIFNGKTDETSSQHGLNSGIEL